MQTFFRLLTVTGAAATLAYGAMYAMVIAVQPQQHGIAEAANLSAHASPYGGELRTGRSVAATRGD